MTTVRHCGATIPQALTGDLKGCNSRCQRVLDAQGRHAGQHKAVVSHYPLGKITFMWRTGWRRKQPPVVTLPAPEWGTRA